MHHKMCHLLRGAKIAEISRTDQKYFILKLPIFQMTDRMYGRCEELGECPLVSKMGFGWA